VKVGIGIAAPTAKLHVVGPGTGTPVAIFNQGASSDITAAVQLLNITASGVAGTPIHYDTSNRVFGFTSSIRYKTNVRSLTNESQALYNLNPVLYDAKEGYGTGVDIPGFIAEQVYAVAPELSVFNKEGQPETYSLNGVVAYAVKEVQNLKKLVDEQAAQIDNQSILLQQQLIAINALIESMPDLHLNLAPLNVHNV
jgi:hypothetical protein